MKKRILVGLALAVMLISVLSVSASAKWWDENPFRDVKSNAWYYDAVRICNENELFNGTTKTTFEPSTTMSRAMLAQVLANADGFNKADYKGTSFSDVKEGQWFAPAVEWAYRNKITDGTGSGRYSPNKLISREQLATMLRRYAEYKEMDVSYGEDSLKDFPDAISVSTWATDGLAWAVEKGVVSGADVKGTLYLNPGNTATRAEAAKMLSNFLYLAPRYEINGNDLSLYKIVYPSVCLEHVSRAANELSKYIEYSIGVKLEVVTDETPVGEYEILVGETNREAQGYVTVNRASFKSDQHFACTLQGNYLVIAGIDDTTDLNTADDRSHHNIEGTYKAVYYFLEKEFGLDFYFEGDGIVAEPDPRICFDGNYTYIDAPAFESMGMYIYSLGEDLYLSSGYYKDWGCGLPHQLGNLMTGKWEESGSSSNNKWSNPCYSDPDNINDLIENVRKLLETEPEINMIGLIQNDSDSYCDCKECRKIYTEDGTRAGTLIRLVNAVAEEFAEEEPDVKFATWAYNWSSKPPKTDFKFNKNVILYYNTIELCPAHEYTDTTCEHNKDSAEYIKRWSEISNNQLYLWEHTGAFRDAMAPLLDLDSIRANARYFYENGVRGGFLNGRAGDRPSCFMELRAYLFPKLWLDPMMSEEEYNYHLNGFLKTYYGDAWGYIREYIDTINEIGNAQCTKTHTVISRMYNFDLVYEAGEKINTLWDKAEAAADSETELERIVCHRLSWTYLWQTARYEKDYTNGNEASRAAYREVSRELYESILFYKIKWDGSRDQDEPSGDLEVSPDKW